MPEHRSDPDDKRSIIAESSERLQSALQEHRERLESEIDDLLDRMMREEGGGTRPIFWGWSLELDQEGTPRITTHGNLRERFQQLAEGFEEPMVDWHIDPEHDTVTLTAKLPGVEAEDVIVNVDDRTVSIEAETEDALHEASATLPVDLVPDTAKAHLEGETLTIEIEREPRVTQKAVTVPVETGSTKSEA